MANVVTDPRQHPELVLPDFTKADPLLTFKLADVADRGRHSPCESASTG
jgi:hypothetical protein